MPETPIPAPKSHGKSEARSASKASPAGSTAAAQSAPASRPKTAPSAPPELATFDRKSIRKIRGGRAEIEARVDLHGMRQDEAHARAASFSRPMSQPRPALRAGDHRQRQTGQRKRSCFIRPRKRSRRLEAQRSPLARRAGRAQHRRQLHDGGHPAWWRRRALRSPALEGSRIKIRSTRSEVSAVPLRGR